MRAEGYPPEWAEALSAYLACVISKVANYNSTLAKWQPTGNKAGNTFTHWALPMVWDFAENNPLRSCCSSGHTGARLAFWYLDPIAGLAVSVLIVKMSITLLRPNIGILMDERPDTVILDEITAIAQKVLGVRAIDSLRVHRRGSTFTVDVEIAVDSGLTVEQRHQVASEVKRTLLSKIQYTQDVVVHVNPYRPMRICNKEVRHVGGR